MKAELRLSLFALGFLLAFVAALLFVTGGFTHTTFGIRISARSPSTAATAAAVLFAVWAFIAYRARALAADLNRISRWLDIRARVVIVVIAALGAAVAISYGTFSASGADASGYFSEAEMLTELRLRKAEPLGAIADWNDAPATLAPLGWHARGATDQVPTYPVGLPLLMAIPHRLGGAIAASLIVPLSFAIAIFVTGMMATRLAGAWAGLIAVVALATNPVALIEAMQPMSDVPVTAAWMATWWMLVPSAGCQVPGAWCKVPGAMCAGVVCAIAVLIRPNLAPLAAVPAIYVWWVSRQLRPVIAFSIPVALAGIVIAFLQWEWFGSPLRSGYGTAEEIFALSNVAPNIAADTGWLRETRGLWLLLAPLSLFVAPSILRWMLAFAALVCVAYLFYAVFDNWTYLRFLLPATAIAIIAIATLVVSVVRRAPAAVMPVAMLLLTIAVASVQIAAAREHAVFRTEARHARGLLAGRYLDSVLPANAVLITGEQSGAMRYYTHRPILRWDLLAAADFTLALDRVTAAGREPWFVLDDWEESLVRQKFGNSPAAALDWPPLLDAGREVRTRAWRLADRDRYLRGDRVIPDRVR